jgi:hypothetical protein
MKFIGGAGLEVAQDLCFEELCSNGWGLRVKSRMKSRDEGRWRGREAKVARKASHLEDGKATNTKLYLWSE